MAYPFGKCWKTQRFGLLLPGSDEMHEGRVYLITGVTGMVGRYLAETLRKEGASVRALVRQPAQSPWLEVLGVECIQGDLEDSQAIAKATSGVTHVVHTAAKVGDWGPVGEYRKVNVEGLRRLLEGCKGGKIERFVHLSSLGVYEAKDHNQTDESVAPPEKHMDGYTQSKVESEKLALELGKSLGIPVTVIRPGFIYGPHDRTVVPNLVSKIKSGDFKYLGSGQQALNCIFVGNLVHGIRMALESPKAVGEIFNLTDGEKVSKRRFVETLCEKLKIKAPGHFGVPMPVARIMASVGEGLYRMVGAKNPPILTKAKVKFLGLNLDFSIEKAKRVLGYQPQFGFDDAMVQTVDWFASIK